MTEYIILGIVQTSDETRQLSPASKIVSSLGMLRISTSLVEELIGGSSYNHQILH